MERFSVTMKIDSSFDDFNSFETDLKQEIEREVPTAVKAHLEGLDEKLGKQFKSSHPGYVCHGKARRKLSFWYGTIWVERRRYRCRGKRDVYPLDAYLPDSSVSGLVDGLALTLATQIPYGRSSRLLGSYTATSVSSMGIWHKVQSAGRLRRAQIEGERRRIFEQGRDDYPQDYVPDQEAKVGTPFFVEADGTMVSSREEGKERFEVKLGVMYRGVEKTGKRRRRLVDKFVYSAVEDSDAFEELFYSGCRKEGLDSRSGIEYISDGAGWLRNMGGDMFPEAVKRLDLYHLKKACCGVVSDEEWKALQRCLFEGDVEAFVDTLEAVVTAKDMNPAEQTELLDYVLANKDSLNYGKGKRNGSGAVEKNIGIYVGRRFKRQGMSWSKEGANNLLALRTEKLNTLWTEKFGS